MKLAHMTIDDDVDDVVVVVVSKCILHSASRGNQNTMHFST